MTFEYVLLDGVNDTARHARSLVRLMRAVPAKVNLIPFNGFPGAGFRCSPPAAVTRFHGILSDAGIMTTTRKTRGDDIDAACGQLAGQFHDRTRRSQRMQSDQMSVSS